MLDGCDRWIVFAALIVPQIGPPRPTRRPVPSPPIAEVEVRDATTGEALAGVTILRASTHQRRHPGPSGALEALARDGVSPLRLQGTNADWNEAVWVAAKGHAWTRAIVPFWRSATGSPERRVVTLAPGGDVRLEWPEEVLAADHDPIEQGIVPLELARLLVRMRMICQSPESVPLESRPEWSLLLLDEPGEDYAEDRAREVAANLEGHAKGTSWVGWTAEQVRHEAERIDRRTIVAHRFPFVEARVSGPCLELDHLPIGRWLAVLSAPGMWRGPIATAEFKIEAGSCQVVQFATVRPRPLTGTVVVPEEWGLAELSIHARGRFGDGTMEFRSIAATRSGADPGRWTFDAGPAYPGPIDLTIGGDPFRSEQYSLRNLDEPIVLEAPPCAIVDVRVVDSKSGGPVRVDALRASVFSTCGQPRPEATATPCANLGEWEIRIPACGTPAWIFELEGEHEVLPPFSDPDVVQKSCAPAFPPGRSRYELRVRPSRGVRLHVVFDGVEVALRPERGHLFQVIDPEGEFETGEYQCDAGGRGRIRLHRGGRFRVALFPGSEQIVTEEVVVPDEGFFDVTIAPPDQARNCFD